jgi:hypothetical protein
MSTKNSRNLYNIRQTCKRISSLIIGKDIACKKGIKI